MLQCPEHFPKALKKRVEEWNDKAAALDAVEAGLPQRRAELCGKILDGTIIGADAVAERQAIETAALANDVDRCRLYHEKAAFRDDFKAAFTAEGDRLAKIAVARKAALMPKVQEFDLPEAARNQIVGSDAAFRSADMACRAARSAAQAGTLDQRDVEWFRQFEASTLAGSGVHRSGMR